MVEARKLGQNLAALRNSIGRARENPRPADAVQ
jgi:hypothetical protein